MNDLISRQALCEYALNQKDKSVTPNDIMRFPSAQPEKRTEERTKTHSCDLIDRQAAIEALKEAFNPSITNFVKAKMAIDNLPSAQPDMSEYSDKLWKAAYERGKAEAQPDLDDVYAHAETEAEARYHAEIVRCKDCKHRTSYWGNCRLLEEKYHQSVLVDGDSFCSMAERRTDA